MGAERKKKGEKKNELLFFFSFFKTKIMSETCTKAGWKLDKIEGREACVQTSSPHRIAILSFIVGVTVVIVVALAILKQPTAAAEKTRFLGTAVDAVFVALWPIVFTALVHDAPARLLWPGFGWVYMVFALNTFLRCDAAKGAEAEKTAAAKDPADPPSHPSHPSHPSPPHRLHGIQMEPGGLTAIAFGLSSLCGSHPNSRYSHLFTVSILTCFLIVVPRHTLDPSCVTAVIYEGVQRNCLQFCISIIITAVLLTRFSRPKEEPGK